MRPPALFVERLFLHPVKSLRGIEVTSAVPEARGFRFDRRFLVVDGGGSFLTLREHPAMTLIVPSIIAEGPLAGGARLRLEAPGCDPLEVPFEGPVAARRTVRIWRDTVEAEVLGAEVDRWISRALGVPAALVRMGEAGHRAVETGYGGTGEVSFADGYPYLVATSASLAHLAAQIPSLPSLPMERFRPNVVVGGAAPWEEDGWRALLLPDAGLSLSLPKPCARCTVPNVDPQTAERGPEPLATLARVRRSEKGVLFGVNAVAAELPAFAVVRVGDRVEVTARGAAPEAFSIRTEDAPL